MRFAVPSARLAFTDRTLTRVVEPGDVELWVGPSCAERELATTVTLAGEVHEVTTADARLVNVDVVRGRAPRRVADRQVAAGLGDTETDELAGSTL